MLGKLTVGDLFFTPSNQYFWYSQDNNFVWLHCVPNSHPFRTATPFIFLGAHPTVSNGISVFMTGIGVCVMIDRAFGKCGRVPILT